MEKGEISVVEAGRRGGNQCKANHDEGYYSRMGEKGGAAAAKRRGPEFYARIGRRGIEARRAKAERRKKALTEEKKGE